MTSAPTAEAAQAGVLHVAGEFLAQPAQEHHIVQFYEDDEFLADVVAHYVGAGLRAAEPTIVIATGPHLSAFCARLQASGFDVAAAQRAGSFVTLDARETLDRFVVDGMPDAERFRSSVGGAVAELARTSCHARVRAYGEMVDVLYAEGNVEAALALEELWNQLAAEQSFSLLCAYSMSRFPSGDDGAGLLRVCQAHSHVIPTEGYARIRDDDARLREVVQLQQRARALEREIAERKAVEGKLRESLRQRDDFLAIAGHELKTPLTAAQLMMESLVHRTQEGVPPAVTDRVVKAARSLERLGKLVDGVLDVTRLTTSPMALAREELDLVALVHDAIEAARPALSNARCTVSVEADGPVCGRWDRQRLMQTLADLLSNAYKYGGTRPIALRVERGAERARLVVRDQGIGIASEDQGRIFERFERSAVTFEAWGLGLGLWTARLAVEAHGGSIAVRSEVGRGATFIVELPYDG